MNQSVRAFADIIIVTGHYGTGKTNLSVNLAVDLTKAGKDVVLMDLDIVNPYFRAADFATIAEQQGFELIAPPFANTNLDIPVVTAALHTKLAGSQTLLLDIGGDDAGAMVLGRYAPVLAQRSYSMVYVINSYRHLTDGPAEAVRFLKEIETVSRLTTTHLINNSNLSYETTPETVAESQVFAQEVSRLSGVPLWGTTINRALLSGEQVQEQYYPISIYVQPPWSITDQ